MGEEKRQTKENKRWNQIGHMALHLLIGWIVSNVVFLFITPGTWADLDYVRQIPLAPFLVVMAAGAVISWWRERKRGREQYNAKKKVLMLIAVYLLVAAVLGIADALGVKGII